MHIETQVASILGLVTTMTAAQAAMAGQLAALTTAVSSTSSGTGSFDPKPLMDAVNANTAAVTSMQTTVTQLQADLEVDENAASTGASVNTGAATPAAGAAGTTNTTSASSASGQSS